MSTATSSEHEPFVHPALFYRGSEQYTAGTVPFLRAGLSAGEAVAVAVPGPNLELIRDALGASAAEVEFLDMTRAGRNPGRIIPGVLRAFADAHKYDDARPIAHVVSNVHALQRHRPALHTD